MITRLIIIEDDPLFAELVKRALEGLMESVMIASSWDEAQEQLDTSNLAWADLRLSPQCREQESIHRIEELRAKRPDIVIVVGSGFITPETRAKLERAGVDGCFYKDKHFSVNQVASLILNAIMRANLRGHEVNKKLLTRALEWMHEKHPHAA